MTLGERRRLPPIGAVSGLLIVPLTASDLPLWQALGVSVAIGAALGSTSVRTTTDG